MIANFFRHLNRYSTRFLLVSGQATILYGAATFSEQALRASQATYYKLTAPLSAEHALRHHGFHFLLPGSDGGIPGFLDVMGYPPRVGTFAEAFNRSRLFDTDWGSLPSVDIPDLVDSRRPSGLDYPIISFWRPVVDDLRQLRAEGKLLPQGTPV